MKIKKLQIQSFEGFEDTFEYEFTQPLNALCLKNGAGKTSFLNALRYAITGIKPLGNAINNNASQMAVGLTFHDGTGIIRQDFADKSARYFMNRRPVTKKALDEMLQSRAGVAQGTMKIATSTDILAGLKPQEFGELLLSYIPETLDTEKILNMLDSVSEVSEKEIRDFFGTESFGTEMVDAFYKNIMDKRKALNKKIQECEAYLNHFSSVPATDKTVEEIQNEIAVLTKQQGSVNLYNEQLKNYNDALKRKNKREADINELRKKIAQIGDISLNEAEIKEAKEKLPELEKRMDEYKKELLFVDQTVETLTKALEDINKPVCPLSEKLKCTTDKSAIRSEIETTLKAGQEKQKDVNVRIRELSETITSYRKKVEEYPNKKMLSERKKDFEEQLSRLMKDEIKVPEEPKKVDVEDCSEKIKILANTLSAVKSAEDIKKVRTYVDTNRPVLAAYNDLVKIFAPKGIIKQKISEYYLGAFEDQCNQKAEELLPGMTLKFISDGGISVLTDIRGDGNYVSFDGLSGGEKSYVLFLILDMINSLTGLRMMFLDELSVLDKDAFETLVKLIKANVEDYDLVIMATAEHDDNLKTLQDNGINMINF